MPEGTYIICFIGLTSIRPKSPWPFKYPSLKSLGSSKVGRLRLVRDAFARADPSGSQKLSGIHFEGTFPCEKLCSVAFPGIDGNSGR